MHIRVFLADDDELCVRQLDRRMRGFAELNVIGTAHDGEEAVREIDRLQPDLLFLDVEMPGLTGLQVLQRLRHRPLVVMITAHDHYRRILADTDTLCWLPKPIETADIGRVLERIRHVVQVARQIGSREL